MLTHGDKSEGLKELKRIWAKAKPRKDRYSAQDTLDMCAQRPLNHYSERNRFGILYG